MIEGVARWVDRRLGAANFVRDKLNYVFPENWSFLFGEIALYSFVVLVATGIFLTLFFNASAAEVTYHGSYLPLRGEEMSEAFRSVLALSFDVRGGLLMRQIHHWAALIFVAAMIIHLSRVFFTGAFRRPREINWMIGVTLLLLGIFNGFSGYSLPDDILSGTGLRIAYAIAESVPVIGTWLVSLFFGGAFPGEQILGRLYSTHIFLVPALITALIAGHLALIARQHHTQFPGPGRREDNVVGLRLWPSYAAKSVGLFFVVAAVLAGLGGLFQINPIWFWGPYDPYLVSTAAQPDWYMGWLEGALRLWPPVEVTAGGYMIASPFFPAVLLPGVTFAGLYAYPFVEQRLTGDYGEHHLLDRPRDRPGRTAFGAGTLTFFFLLFLAGSQDVIAKELGIRIVALVRFLQGAVIVLPPLVALAAYRWCKDLAASGKPAGYEQAEAPRDPTPWRQRELATADAGTSGSAASTASGRRNWRAVLAGGGVLALIAWLLRRAGDRRIL